MGVFDFFKRLKPPQPTPLASGPAPVPAAPPLSEDACALFAEVARDEKGELVKIRVPGQVVWDTNGKRFVDEKGPGKQGRWKAAVEELVAADLIGPIGMSPYQLYLITKKGAAIRSAATRAATNN